MVWEDKGVLIANCIFVFMIDIIGCFHAQQMARVFLELRVQIPIAYHADLRLCGIKEDSPAFLKKKFFNIFLGNFVKF